MKSLGLIEVKGLLAAIESADVMLKSADVSILEKSFVGGGLVSVLVVGDVGAVKAAVEAGVAAVKRLGEEFLVSEHVIARPHDELSSIIGTKTQLEVLDTSIDKEESKEYIEIVENQPIKESLEAEELTIENLQKTEEDTLIKEKSKHNLPTNLDTLNKKDIDKLVNENGMEKALLALEKLKVVKLRNLAREYKDFPIVGRMISKSDKNLLLSKFKLYYENFSK